MMDKLIFALKNPIKIFAALSEKGWFDWISDKAYLKLLYKSKTGKTLDLKNPQTFNEKLNWIKLYDRNPLYTKLVDKYEVKEYVAKCIGEKYVIPTLGVWDSFEDIDFDKLPEQFVLKCTHDSGGLVICTEKSKLDKETARKKIEKSLKRNFYKKNREWPYKDVKPRIIAEKYMKDEETGELRDYKFFSFDGVAKVLCLASGRYKEGGSLKFDFFDEDFNHLDIRYKTPNAEVPPAKPKKFEQMKELAGTLSKGIPHVRVDFYEVNGEIYFGELTFFPGGGYARFNPRKWEKIFGDWIVLPEKTKG